MTDQPFSPGGIIPSRGPGSDLIPPFSLDPAEQIVSFDALRRWRAGELSLQDLLDQSGPRPSGEVSDDGGES